ncbi:MAG TPA: RsmD family RNA methyltransferase, partial [Acidimicrobiia bacterium]|nr:RsmD family RNA methyltransferase [Acidimicrobiia bacterium]
MPAARRSPRIIAGEAGGRRLAVPPGDKIRPTSDRVKESVFAALGPDRLAGARVLDLYAGTGALGLEALSRG